MGRIYRRIESLREKMLNVSHDRFRKREYLSIFNGQPIDKPLVVRKAMAFDLLLRRMPIFIEDDELIVGGRTLFLPREKDAQFWDLDVKRNLDFAPDAETLAVEAPGLEFFPHYATEDEIEAARQFGIGEGYVTSHCTAGYAKVLTMGFGGIKAQAEDRLTTVGPDSGQAAFLESVIISMDAATHLVERYEKEVHKKAASASNPARKRELKKIAHILGRIKTEPAATFQEALQLLWMAHTMILIENYNLMALGRLDQYLWPYYRKGIESGTMTREQALELLACFFIKLNDTSDLHTDNGLNIILSGLKPDGTDGTNDFTWLCFDAFEMVKLTDPQINVRFHKNTPQSVIERTNCIEKLGPRPMLYNDDTIIKAMQRVGVSTEDARDYCIDACQDLMIEGKSDFYAIFAGHYGIHLLTIMERVVDRLPDYDSFEAFHQAFKDEIDTDIREFAIKANAIDEFLPSISPTPFLSATLEGCIESGKDKTEGGTIYNFTGFVGGGITNVANSLAAIKKLVYEEKVVDPVHLVEALKRDFAKDASLQKLLRNKAPKFGNNDDYVDLLCRDTAEHFCKVVLAQKNPRGGSFVPGFFTHHQARLGKVVRSTPDGRRRGEPLAVSFSPSHGTDKKGPTAAVLSAAKIDQTLCPLGTSLDLMFHSGSVYDPEEREKVMALATTYFDLGGMELQTNTVSAEVLKAAQKDPDQYRDLVVRVWGFNAYFVTLKKEYQEELIARTSY